jgi:hypothetical protein
MEQEVSWIDGGRNVAIEIFIRRVDVIQMAISLSSHIIGIESVPVHL